MARSEAQINQYKSGKTNLFDYFVGQVMKETKGKANPVLTKELITKYLEKQQKISTNLTKVLIYGIIYLVIGYTTDKLYLTFTSISGIIPITQGLGGIIYEKLCTRLCK